MKQIMNSLTSEAVFGDEGKKPSPNVLSGTHSHSMFLEVLCGPSPHLLATHSICSVNISKVIYLFDVSE